MKKTLGVLLFSIIWFSCQDNENTSEFTGNETTYFLQSGSEYQVSGTVTIKENRDGTSTLLLNLTGTSGNSKLPVHLHMGDISTPGADIAALLSPVDAKTGISETILTQLADESMIQYVDLIKLEACIKVHLSDVGPEQNIILAAGNIGESVAKASASGRIGVGVCKSE